MARYQWKKYKIDYDVKWEAYLVNANAWVRVGTNDMAEVYTDYILHDDGKIELTKPEGVNYLKSYETFYAAYKGTSWYVSEIGPHDTNVQILKFKLSRNFTRINYTTLDYSDLDCQSILERRIVSKTPKRGAYVGTVISTSNSFYPSDGEKDGFWYVYDKQLNSSPIISGSDLDLGSKTEDFEIDYVVSDEDGDVVTVSILVDDVVKVDGKSVPLGVNQKYLVRLDDFSLGDHKVEIRAKDSKGEDATPRIYYFSKANTAPVISGTDADLGPKSTGFSVSYRVDDKDADSVSVRISLDSKEMASISDAQGKDLRFTLDEAKVRELEIGKTYTITIKADDGKGGVAYRRYSFTKVNTPPIISGVDKDLGKVKDPVTIKFSVSDVEKDKIYFSLLLDGKEVMSQEGAVDGKEYSYKIDHDTFIRLTYGKHELMLLAWDDENLDKKVIRKFSFERISGGLDVEVKLAEYDTKPKKIVAVPHGDFIDAKTFQVLACNNYLDAKPTWEDITNMSKIARAFSFTNTTKTASKWALGVRVIIENGKADVSSVLRGIKGGIE